MVVRLPLLTLVLCVVGKNKKQTPCKMGGDRFIPVRNNKQMDVASFLITKENEPVEAKNSTALSLVSRVYKSPMLSGLDELDILINMYFFHEGNPEGLVCSSQWIQHR